MKQILKNVLKETEERVDVTEISGEVQKRVEKSQGRWFEVQVEGNKWQDNRQDTERLKITVSALIVKWTVATHDSSFVSCGENQLLKLFCKGTSDGTLEFYSTNIVLTVKKKINE